MNLQRITYKLNDWSYHIYANVLNLKEKVSETEDFESQN